MTYPVQYSSTPLTKAPKPERLLLARSGSMGSAMVCAPASFTADAMVAALRAEAAQLYQKYKETGDDALKARAAAKMRASKLLQAQIDQQEAKLGGPLMANTSSSPPLDATTTLDTTPSTTSAQTCRRDDNADKPKRTCVVCSESEDSVVLIQCDEGHPICQVCLDKYILTNVKKLRETDYLPAKAETAQISEDGATLAFLCGACSCPLRGHGCGAAPFGDRLIAMNVSDLTFAEYSEGKALLPIARKVDQVVQEGSELALLMPNARMCARCHYGPVELAAGSCNDLTMHHGEVRAPGRAPVSNACPNCGWFADTITAWPRWVRQTTVEEATWATVHAAQDTLELARGRRPTLPQRTLARSPWRPLRDEQVDEFGLLVDEWLAFERRVGRMDRGRQGHRIRGREAAGARPFAQVSLAALAQALAQSAAALTRSRLLLRARPVASTPRSSAASSRQLDAAIAAAIAAAPRPEERRPAVTPTQTADRARSLALLARLTGFEVGSQACAFYLDEAGGDVQAAVRAAVQGATLSSPSWSSRDPQLQA